MQELLKTGNLLETIMPLLRIVVACSVLCTAAFHYQNEMLLGSRIVSAAATLSLLRCAACLEPSQHRAAFVNCKRKGEQSQEAGKSAFRSGQDCKRRQLL
jgi:hypothetical protein